MNTAAVLTISDSSFKGTRKDLSGPAVAQELAAAGFQVTITAIVPDEREQIQQKLIECCGRSRLVVTVGGTGIATRDVTPEATLAVVERLIEGIPERMRAVGATKTPLAALSRGLCGMLGKSLVLNLPGSPKAAVEQLGILADLLPHALKALAGRCEHRRAPAGAAADKAAEGGP